MRRGAGRRTRPSDVPAGLEWLTDPTTSFVNPRDGHTYDGVPLGQARFFRADPATQPASAGTPVALYYRPSSGGIMGVSLTPTADRTESGFLLFAEQHAESPRPEASDGRSVRMPTPDALDAGHVKLPVFATGPENTTKDGWWVLEKESPVLALEGIPPATVERIIRQHERGLWAGMSPTEKDAFVTSFVQAPAQDSVRRAVPNTPVSFPNSLGSGGSAMDKGFEQYLRGERDLTTARSVFLHEASHLLTFKRPGVETAILQGAGDTPPGHYGYANRTEQSAEALRHGYDYLRATAGDDAALTRYLRPSAEERAARRLPASFGRQYAAARARGRPLSREQLDAVARAEFQEIERIAPGRHNGAAFWMTEPLWQEHPYHQGTRPAARAWQTHRDAMAARLRTIPQTRAPVEEPDTRVEFPSGVIRSVPLRPPTAARNPEGDATGFDRARADPESLSTVDVTPTAVLFDSADPSPLPWAMIATEIVDERAAAAATWTPLDATPSPTAESLPTRPRRGSRLV